MVLTYLENAGNARLGPMLTCVELGRGGQGRKEHVLGGKSKEITWWWTGRPLCTDDR